MGSPFTEAGRNANEIAHRVLFTNDYYMAVFETTQGQFTRMGSERSFYYNGDEAEMHPADYVNFWHIHGSGCVPTDGRGNPGSIIGNFCKATGIDFDLPTEAQWEYACRAGNEGNPPIEDMAWTRDNSAEGYEAYSSHKVGTKAPNAWGLYDMFGNVYEWCVDWRAAYTAEDAVEPAGGTATDGNIGRALRGGSYGRDTTALLRYARRDCDANAGGLYDRGFRLICPVALKW